AERRDRAGGEAGQIDAEIRQPEGVAERTLGSPRHPRGEGLGIVRPPWRSFGGEERDETRRSGFGHGGPPPRSVGRNPDGWEDRAPAPSPAPPASGRPTTRL